MRSMESVRSPTTSESVPLPIRRAKSIWNIRSRGMHVPEKEIGIVGRRRPDVRNAVGVVDHLSPLPKAGKPDLAVEPRQRSAKPEPACRAYEKDRGRPAPPAGLSRVSSFVSWPHPSATVPAPSSAQRGARQARARANRQEPCRSAQRTPPPPRRARRRPAAHPAFQQTAPAQAGSGRSPSSPGSSSRRNARKW